MAIYFLDNLYSYGVEKMNIDEMLQGADLSDKFDTELVAG